MIATITVVITPNGVAVTPDGGEVYVANEGSNNVSVITTETDTVVGSPIPIGIAPFAFGVFIQPATPDTKICRYTWKGKLSRPERLGARQAVWPGQ